MIPLYILAAIWFGLGIWCWTFIEWFSIKEEYRQENLGGELKGHRIWECLLFCLIFGPMAWLITLPKPP